MECGWGVIILLILYIIWDVNYFIRVVFTVVFGRLFQKKVKLTETTSILGKYEVDDLVVVYVAIYNKRIRFVRAERCGFY